MSLEGDKKDFKFLLKQKEDEIRKISNNENYNPNLKNFEGDIENIQRTLK